MLLLPSPLVDCCYCNVLLLSVSPLAALCQHGYQKMMLLAAGWLLRYQYYLLLLSPLATLCRQDHAAAFTAGWLPSPPVDCCYLTNIIILSLLAALLCWHCEMLLFLSPPVHCCHFNNLLLSLSSLATLSQTWYHKMMLLPLPPVHCRNLDIIIVCWPLAPLLCSNNHDVAAAITAS